MPVCNLCKFPVLRILKGPFGLRCIRCRSTVIHRSIGLAVQEMNFNDNIFVYELSSRGALYNFLRKKFMNLSYSEFFDDTALGEFKNGIQCQDVQNLTFHDNYFDLVTSTEVFEHVPDDIKGFNEVYRILKKGGHFIFTVPLSNNENTVERAKLIDGNKVLHLIEPEYHKDRIRGWKVLAYRNYGLDILELLRSVGFQVALRTFDQKRHGIINGNVLICRK